jgi:hypothetical protein
MDAFSYSIRAVCLCPGVNIELENSAVEKRSLFPALANLRKFLRNCSLGACKRGYNNRVSKQYVQLVLRLEAKEGRESFLIEVKLVVSANGASVV